MSQADESTKRCLRFPGSHIFSCADAYTCLVRVDNQVSEQVALDLGLLFFGLLFWIINNCQNNRPIRNMAADN